MKPLAHLPLLTLLVASGAPLASASAQDATPTDPHPTRQASAPGRAAPGRAWELRLGAGMLYGPAFLGSRDYQLRAGPIVEAHLGDRLHLSVVDGATFDLLKTRSLRAGPVIKYQEGRQQDGDALFVVAGGRTHALRGLGDVDATVEVGGYAQYQSGRLSAKVELRQGLGGHEGLVADLGLRLQTALTALSLGGRPLLVSAGPRATFVDAQYNQAYFGVDAGQSARSGLRPFDPEGGLLSYGVAGALIFPVSGDLSAVLLGGVDRLAGDARRSPLVRERGARDQATLAVGLSYRLGP